MTEKPTAYGEDDLLPLSGLQHLSYCERQAALIHVERLWADNRYTIEGSHMHRRVDDTGPRRERRGDVIVVRGLRIRSFELGLAGRADVVEFRRARGPVAESVEKGGLASSVSLRGTEGRWTPSPIEYKRGRPKAGNCDEVQVCAQAMCLEEMLRVRVPEGALFYGKRQRRHEVVLDATLRRITAEAGMRFHELVRSGTTPRAEWKEGCKRCSFLDVCLPGAMSGVRSARAYLDGLADEALRDAGEEES